MDSFFSIAIIPLEKSTSHTDTYASEVALRIRMQNKETFYSYLIMVKGY